jgi:hypothetical protein
MQLYGQAAVEPPSVGVFEFVVQALPLGIVVALVVFFWVRRRSRPTPTVSAPASQQPQPVEAAPPARSSSMVPWVAGIASGVLTSVIASIILRMMGFD